MKVYIVAMAVLASACGACNVDNADSPANTVTIGDTTTTDPQPLETDAGLMPGSIDTAAVLADTSNI